MTEIKIGCVDIDTSHPLAFAKCLLKGGRGRYTAVYNDGFRGDEEVEAFIENFGLDQRCRSVSQLAEISDVGFIHSCNWDEHLPKAMPFIEAGKPVFIDKPIAGNLDDCRRLKELALSGAVIMGASSMRYAPEIAEFNSLEASLKGEILNIYGTVGVDEFNYAIHIVEAISQIAGGKPVWGKFDNKEKKAGIETRNFSFGFDNGVLAGYTVTCGVWQPCAITIMTTKGVFQFEIDSSRIYNALLENICDEVEAKSSRLAAIDELIDSIKIMLAGKASLEAGGEKTPIDQIPRQTNFDGAAFAKEYAAKSSPIYL